MWKIYHKKLFHELRRPRIKLKLSSGGKKWAQSSIEKLTEIFKSCNDEVFVTYPQEEASDKVKACFIYGQGKKLRKAKDGIQAELPEC